MNINEICPGCMAELANRKQLMRCPHCGYDLTKMVAKSHQLQPLTMLENRYAIGRVIGEGGFGITYLGADINLELRVAIKEFFPHQFVTRNTFTSNEMNIPEGENKADVEKWRKKSIEEARMLAKFSTLPGIVKVFHFFEANNTAYMVMEYLDGIDLKKYLNQVGGKLPAKDVFELMRPVIHSLDQIHNQHYIHRDISPDNIMWTKQGEIKLLDFGAAYNMDRMDEKDASIQLKPGYAPQEQYLSKGNLGTWTDVYALCATMYKCITGYTPPAANDRARMDNLIGPSQLGAQMNPQQENTIMRGLAINAENRIPNMKELYNCLYASQPSGGASGGNGGTGSGGTGGKGMLPPPNRPKGKAPLIAAIVGGSTLFLVLCIVLIVTLTGDKEKAVKDDTIGTEQTVQTKEPVPEKKKKEEVQTLNKPEWTNPNIGLGDECIAQNNFYDGFNYYLLVGENDPDYEIACERIHTHIGSYVEYAKSIRDDANSQPNYENYEDALRQLDRASDNLNQMLAFRPDNYDEYCDEMLYITAQIENDFANWSLNRAAEYSDQKYYDQAEELLASVMTYILNRPYNKWQEESRSGYINNYYKTYANNANAKSNWLAETGYSSEDIAHYLAEILPDTGYNAYTIELYDLYAQQAGIMKTVERMKNTPDYLIPDSDTRELYREDIEGMTRTQLRMARFEIYARHGRLFADQNSVQSYFDTKSWYRGTIEPPLFDDSSLLSEVEKANARLIAQYEIEQGYIY